MHDHPEGIPTSAPAGRVIRLVVGRPGWIVGIWIAVIAALGPLATGLPTTLDVTARVHGSEAAAVDSMMARALGSPIAQYALLTVTGLPAPTTSEGRGLLERVLTVVDTVDAVTVVASYLTARDTFFIGRDGSTFLIVGLDPGIRRLDAVIPRLRRATAPLNAELAAAHPGAALRWTGAAAVNYDIRRASANEGRRSELRALPFTLLLLLIGFGAVLAAALPIAMAGMAIAGALGAVALLNAVWPLSILVQNIVSMIGLGVGIDYALLTVSRFREARTDGREVRAAAAEAARHAGGTIALSGVAVCIGFAALLLLPLNELQSIGIAGVVIVGISVAAATTLLPAVLALLGDRIEFGRVGRGWSPDPARWRTWGKFVIAHPVGVLLAALVPLAVLSWQATRLETGLPRGNWLPRGIESGLAMGDLLRMERGGVPNSLRVLVQLPDDATLYTEAGWSNVREVVRRVERDARVARVGAVTSLHAGDSLTAEARAFLPAGVTRSLMSVDGRTAVIEVLPGDTVDFTAVSAFVRDVRDSGFVAGILPGTRLRVGGTPALNVDYEDAIAAHALPAVVLVLVLTLGALMVGFRSVLIPVKAIVLNLLSVAAAFGAVVLVFQDGHAAAVLGLDAPLSSVFPAIPVLVFCVVFGLSMDYEVFLVARIAEARARLPEGEAIVEGLARTGGVITSAAAIMVVVFGAFALGQFVFIKILGFALAVAILVDATVVRLAVGPALLVLAGRWNWWPGRRHSGIVAE